MNLFFVDQIIFDETNARKHFFPVSLLIKPRLFLKKMNAGPISYSLGFI